MSESPAEQKPTVPVAIRFALRRLRDPHVRSAIAAAVGVGDTLDDQHYTISLLELKKRELTSSSLTLSGIKTTDPVELDGIQTEIGETAGEIYLCDAKITTIEADQPFNAATDQQVSDLQAAIQAVDAATANSQAVADLIGAVHQLVLAFPAKDV